MKSLQYTIENGEILFLPSTAPGPKLASGYVQIVTPQGFYHSRDFVWKRGTEKDSLELIGQSQDGKIIQYWKVRKFSENQLEWLIHLSIIQDIEVDEIYTAVSCLPAYWRWHNSFRYGVFPSPSYQLNQVSWFGNPLDEGISASTGRNTFPDIHMATLADDFHSSAKIVTNPDTKSHELRYYRKEPLYGPGKLFKGDYKVFYGVISYQETKLVKFPEVEKLLIGRSDPAIFILNACGFSMTDYFLETILPGKEDREQVATMDAEAISIKGTGVRQSRIKTLLDRMNAFQTVRKKTRTLLHRKPDLSILLIDNFDYKRKKFLNYVLFSLIASNYSIIVDGNGKEKVIHSRLLYLLSLVTTKMMSIAVIFLKIISLPLDVFILLLVAIYLFIIDLFDKLRGHQHTTD